MFGKVAKSIKKYRLSLKIMPSIWRWYNGKMLVASKEKHGLKRGRETAVVAWYFFFILLIYKVLQG